MDINTGLGNSVFFDLNANGIQDEGEFGAGDVLVKLLNPDGSAALDSDGQPITTTTAGNGTYSFTGLTAGEYKVQFVAPEGFTFTNANVGHDNNLDSDANPFNNGITQTILITDGNFNSTIDAGLVRPAGIGNLVFEDANANGIQDAGEQGIAGVEVKLLADTDNDGDIDDVVKTTTTGADGSYEFNGLTQGDYRVMFVQPDGFDTVSPFQAGYDASLNSDANPDNNLMSDVVTLSPGTFNNQIDAGFFQKTPGLGGVVFNDGNADGIQDEGEYRAAGVVVNLLNTDGSAALDSDGTPITTTTDNQGHYAFFNLTPGEYQVQFVAPEGFTLTKANVGNDALDSDANPFNDGITQTVMIADGDFNSTIDAGIVRPAGIGNLVFEDANANGIQDAGEQGIAGVEVKLLADTDNDGDIDDIVKTTTTGADGSYAFNGLTQGDYRVMFVQPDGFDTVSPFQAGYDDSLNSDANPDNQLMSDVVSLNPGTFNNQIDAGFFKKAPGLGSSVFIDANANGMKDNGESGASGVVVNLLNTDGSAALNSDGTPITTTTDNQGNYAFFNLTPGEYQVQFVAPEGFVFTTANAGGDDSLDSDANPFNNGITQTVMIADGDFNDTIDAGLVRPAGIGNFVFEDTNADGVQNAGEQGIAGAEVTLLADTDNDGHIDDVVKTTTTDANGFYEFTGLTQGDYRVKFTQPDGYNTASPFQAGFDSSLNSDANPNNDLTSDVVTLTPGVFNNQIDAGFYNSIDQTKTIKFQHKGLSENFGLAGDLTNLLVGDFDGDGKDDFIRQEKGGWARDRWNMTDVFFSNGDGNFAKQSLMQGSTYLNGNRTNLVVGDFDGDGKDDFIRQEKGGWANDRWNMTDVFFSNGNGTFAKQSLMQGSYYLSGNLTNLVVGDFDGDGKDDFIRQEKAGWANDRWNMTDVFFSNGDGTFARESLMQGSSFLNGNLTNLVVGDFNGDGKDDFMRQEKGYWAHDRANMNQIFFSNGDGTFEQVDVLQNTGLLNGNLTNVLTGDFNGNGKDGFIRQEKSYWDNDRIFTADVYLNTDDHGLTAPADGGYSVSFSFVHSPITLDLNGDGIQTIGIERGVMFDMLDTGNAVSTGWLSGDDGFLAVDNNGDGLISSRAELFGGGVGEGFAKLESFDSNGDGLVNEADDMFADLRLWQDSNENGVTDSGELVSLTTAGITDLVTSHTDVFSTDAAGNVHGEHSSAKRNGSTIEMVDVYFQVTA